MTQKLIQAVKGFEGLRLEAYICPAGVWTIGYGHTRGVTPGMKISQATADRFLEQDLREAQRVVLLNTKGVTITQPQLDALTDFVFNVGPSQFRTSTLLRKLKAGAPAKEVATQFGRWIYARDSKTGKMVTLSGLVRRRDWEAKRFLEER